MAVALLGLSVGLLTEPPRRVVSLASPRRGISVTSARTASRPSTYRIANPTESGPDCDAAPSIPRNRPDHSAAGRAPSGTPEGAGGNSLAGGRIITRTRWVLRSGNHREIKECQSCGRKEKDAGSWHFEVPRVTDEHDLRLAATVFEIQRHEASMNFESSSLQRRVYELLVPERQTISAAAASLTDTGFGVGYGRQLSA